MRARCGFWEHQHAAQVGACAIAHAGRCKWRCFSAHGGACLLVLLQATGKNTFFGKTASLLQQNDEMGHLQVCIVSCACALTWAVECQEHLGCQHAGKFM